jgi:hypothetical protein
MRQGMGERDARRQGCPHLAAHSLESSRAQRPCIAVALTGYLYDATQRNGTLRILHTLLRRMSAAADADIGTTLPHIPLGWHGVPRVPPLAADDLLSAATRIARLRCDQAFARRMLLRPLGWSDDSRRGAWFEHMLHPPRVHGAQGGRVARGSVLS